MVATHEDINGISVVKTGPRIDSANAGAFETVLVEVVNDATGRTVLDLSELGYISSAGLRVILLAAKTAKKAGRELVLCHMQPTIREIFDVSGFARILTIVPTRDDALAT